MSENITYSSLKNIICEGVLNKKSSSVFSFGWNLRYYILNNDALYYFKEPSKPKENDIITGKVDICNAKYFRNAKEPNTAIEIAIGAAIGGDSDDNGRDYLFDALDFKNRDKWVKGLSEWWQVMNRNRTNNARGGLQITISDVKVLESNFTPGSDDEGLLSHKSRAKGPKKHGHAKVKKFSDELNLISAPTTPMSSNLEPESVQVVTETVVEVRNPSPPPEKKVNPLMGELNKRLQGSPTAMLNHINDEPQAPPALQDQLNKVRLERPSRHFKFASTIIPSELVMSFKNVNVVDDKGNLLRTNDAIVSARDEIHNIQCSDCECSTFQPNKFKIYECKSCFHYHGPDGRPKVEDDLDDFDAERTRKNTILKNVDNLNTILSDTQRDILMKYRSNTNEELLSNLVKLKPVQQEEGLAIQCYKCSCNTFIAHMFKKTECKLCFHRHGPTSELEKQCSLAPSLPDLQKKESNVTINMEVVPEFNDSKTEVEESKPSEDINASTAEIEASKAIEDTKVLSNEVADSSKEIPVVSEVESKHSEIAVTEVATFEDAKTIEKDEVDINKVEVTAVIVESKVDEKSNPDFALEIEDALKSEENKESNEESVDNNAEDAHEITTPDHNPSSSSKSSKKKFKKKK